MLVRLRRLFAARVAGSEGSAAYWKHRYDSGDNSGAGSYGKSAEFKAEVLNAFVAANDVRSVIEFGCGDGNQLALARYPRYAGFDVSERAVELCSSRFREDPSKTFGLLDSYADERAELALSLDVIYHLIEDDIFAEHMQMVFGAADRFVAIYSSNTEAQHRAQQPHVRHRRFTDWVAEYATDWDLHQEVANPLALKSGASAASFYLFERRSPDPAPGE